MKEADTLDLPLKNIVRKAGSKGPSIFFLHGFGSNMQDLFGLSPFFPEDWTCISLQASIPIIYGGWAWAELNPNNIAKAPKPDQYLFHQEQIVDSIGRSIELLDLDEKKINLLGFSQGASLSIICGLKSPSIFNSLVALCGFLPIEDLADKIDKTKIKNTKIFMGNGKLDQTVPIHYAHGSRDGLIDMGIKPDYREYNSEHTIPNDCLNDVIVWLKKMNE